MNCPQCGGASQVVNSRHTDQSVRRRRECTGCSKRWTTYEVDEASFIRLGDMESAIRAMVTVFSKMKLRGTKTKFSNPDQQTKALAVRNLTAMGFGK